MNRCETCRWWGKEPDAFYWDQPDRMQLCGKVQAVTSTTTEVSAALIAHDSDMMRLITHKDFGCTLWEGKEDDLR